MPAGLDGNPNPITTPQREHVLMRAVDEVRSHHQPGTPLLVAIDGIDGAGKSTFADELAARLTDDDNQVVRSTIDSFHNPRSTRRAKGATSPAGFYLDSHDLTAVRAQLLDPLRAGTQAGGTSRAPRTYRTAVFDEPTDQPVSEPARTISGHEILVFDGIFLCRPELVDYWDVIVFLDAKARVNLNRLGFLLADAPPGGTELIDHVLQWVERIDRYASGLRYYLDTEDPMARADLVIDNNDLAHPVIVQADTPRSTS